MSGYNAIYREEAVSPNSPGYSKYWIRRIMLFASTLLILAIGVSIYLEATDKFSKTLKVNNYNFDYDLQTEPVSSDEETPYFHKDTLTSYELIREQLQEDTLCHSATKRLYQNEKKNCLESPYIYLTYHGGFGSNDIRTVCKYSRDGCSFGSVLLRNVKYHPRSLRGLLLVHDQMFVADSWMKNSLLALYSRCNAKVDNKREFLDILAEANDGTPELVHPYGFAVNPNDRNFVYISNQGTSLVLKLTKYIKGADKHNNTIVKLENPIAVASFGESQIRGITFDDRNHLYIANKEVGVMVFHANGTYIGTLEHGDSQPISVYYSQETNSLWVGSKKSHKIYEYNLTDWTTIKEIKHKKLRHPAGLLVYKDSLYVVAQKTNQLLRFSTVSGELIHVVLPNLVDDGERIILSPC